MEIFKNKHLGETCYVVGSGKTLAQFHELPEDGVIICCNQGYNHRFVLRNMSYLITEGAYKQVCESVCDDTIIFYERTPPHLNDKHFVSLISEKKNAIPLSFEQINYNHKAQLGNVSCMGYVGAFLANYMGFQKVYLVGMDCDQGRFYTSGTPTSTNNYDICVNGWKALKNHLSHIEFLSINPVNLENVFPENHL